MRSNNGYDLSFKKCETVRTEKDPIRICPECQSRELDEKHPRQKICSECRENNRYFSNLESDAKWRKNNPEKFKASRKISNRKYKLKMKQAG